MRAEGHNTQVVRAAGLSPISRLPCCNHMRRAAPMRRASLHRRECSAPEAWPQHWHHTIWVHGRTPSRAHAGGPTGRLPGAQTLRRSPHQPRLCKPCKLVFVGTIPPIAGHCQYRAGAHARATTASGSRCAMPPQCWTSITARRHRHTRLVWRAAHDCSANCGAGRGGSLPARRGRMCVCERYRER